MGIITPTVVATLQPAAPALEAVALALEVVGRPWAAEPALEVVAPRQVAAGPRRAVAALPGVVHPAAAPALEEALVRVVGPRPEVHPAAAPALVAGLLPPAVPVGDRLQAAQAPPAEALAILVE
jgi:hypothetical protein